MIYYCRLIYLRNCVRRLNMFCAIAFFTALIVFMIIQYGFEYSMMLAYPNILCIDTTYAEFKLRTGYVCAAICFVGLICFVCAMSCRVEGLFEAQTQICWGMAFFPLGLIVFLVGLWGLGIAMLSPEVSRTHMLITGSNGSFYDCGSDFFKTTVNPVLFSSDLVNSSGFICEFWSIDKLCTGYVRPPHNLPLLIDMNGTSGIYHCQSSDLQDLEFCLHYVNTFIVYLIVEIICAAFFPFAILVIYWSCDFNDQPYVDEFYPCCKGGDAHGPCGCEDQHQLYEEL